MQDLEGDKQRQDPREDIQDPEAGMRQDPEAGKQHQDPEGGDTLLELVHCPFGGKKQWGWEEDKG